VNPLRKSLLDRILLVRRHFANWRYIISTYARGKTPHKFVLRDGRVLDFTGTAKRFEFANFARLLDSGWHVETFDDIYMTMKKDLTLKIRYREPPDIFSMREVFLDQVYSCNCEGKVVLDVGMFNGDSSLFFVSRGARKVVGVEPFPDSFKLASENIRLNGMENKIEAHNAAIDTASGTGRLSVRKGEVNFCKLDSQGDDTIAVATIGLDDVIKNQAVGIIKMDCEGCEYPVLNALSKESLSLISEIILEFHDGAIGIGEKLRDSGFRVTFEDRQIGILRAKR
jgi:FkbM family methyltransferase